MKDLENLKPFHKFCCSIGYIPTSYKDSMTYEEQINWFCWFLQEKVVPTVNENANAVKELQEYVSQYFTNLDVQDEINNKLDEMASDGTLAEIINQEIFNELNTTIEGIQGDISDLQTDIANIQNSLNPIDFYSGKNFVVFGDSFSEPNIANSENEYWVRLVAGATGMTRFNFAVAGAGFAREGNMLSSQLTTAQSQMTTEQKNNTAVVIVYAGYNDIQNNVSENDIVDNCVLLVNNIHTTFPNAKIILAPFNWSYGSLSRNYNRTIEVTINRIARETSSKPVVMLKQARYWLLGVVGYFRNSAHPSVSGYKVIASYMIGAIYGSSEHVCISGTLTPSHGSENISQFSFKDGFVNFVFGVKFGEDLEDYAGEQFADLHALVTPETDIIIPLYAVDGYKGTLRLANNGKGYLRNITVEADTWLLANITFSPQAWKVWSE